MQAEHHGYAVGILPPKLTPANPEYVHLQLRRLLDDPKNKVQHLPIRVSDCILNAFMDFLSASQVKLCHHRETILKATGMDTEKSYKADINRQDLIPRSASIDLRQAVQDAALQAQRRAWRPRSSAEMAADVVDKVIDTGRHMPYGKRMT